MTSKELFSAKVCTVCGLGFIVVVIIAICCGKTELLTDLTEIPSRCKVQMFLRDKGYYHGDIDNIIGSKSNAAWDLYEKDVMNYDQARYMEKMGINGASHERIR